MGQPEENIRVAVNEAFPRLQNMNDARIAEQKTRAALVAAGQEEGSIQTPIKSRRTRQERACHYKKATKHKH